MLLQEITFLENKSDHALYNGRKTDSDILENLISHNFFENMPSQRQIHASSRKKDSYGIVRCYYSNYKAYKFLSAVQMALWPDNLNPTR